MAYCKILLWLSLLFLNRESAAQSFGINQLNSMVEVESTTEDFSNYPLIKIEPTRVEVEADAEDNLACAATVVVAITGALIFAALVLVAVFLWYIRSQMKTMVNVYNTINEIQSSGFTGSLSTSTTTQSNSAGNPPEFETASTSLSLQSTSHQNILPDHIYVSIGDVEPDYLEPSEINPPYEKLQYPPLELSVQQSRNSKQGDIPNVMELDPRFDGSSDLESSEIP